MKFEISFDENIYNKQMDLLFDIAWERKITYYKNSQYLGIILIVIGVFLIMNRPNIFGIGYVIVFFGLSNLLPFLYYYFKYKKEYKKLDIAKSEEIEILQKNQNISIEFNEDSLVLVTIAGSKNINWDEFVVCTIRQENLILISKDHMPYILGKDEVGQADFERIISFLKEKIKETFV